MTLERLALEGPAGKLETIVEDPGRTIPRFAVICHPHPLHGGTMDNKVVTTVARALGDEGIPSVRFNFRGVGASAGAFDHGNGETDDAAAVAAWAGGRWPGRRMILAGFSFGGHVALRLARRDPPELLIAVAPAVQYFQGAELSAPRCRCVVIQGEADEVVDPRAVADWVEGLDPRPQLVSLPGVGHFFHGRLPELRDAVRAAARSG